MSALVAQLGARRHYVVPRALHTRGLLARLVTDLCADAPPLSWADAVLPHRLRPAGLKRLLGRHADGIPPALICNLTRLALRTDLRRRSGEAATDYWARRNAAFATAVVERGFDGADTVYGFNGAALEIFEAARARGLRTVLDQTAAPWRYNARLLEEEMALWPDWEDGSGEQDRSGLLAEREEREWALADAIVCGSKFAAEAVGASGGPSDRCRVLPYTGHVRAGPAHSVQPDAAAPLKVLYVGSLQLRKGVQYLARAAQSLAGSGIEIRLAGKPGLTDRGLCELARHCTLLGEVARVEVGRLYEWADVFVLPTLSEGSANVVYEAMAAGLAVVTTDNAGSIVEHGESGLIVPVRDADALAGTLAMLAGDAAMRARLGQAAQAAIGRGGLDAYADGLAGAVGAGQGSAVSKQVRETV